MDQFNFFKIHPLFIVLIFIVSSTVTSGTASPGYGGSSSNSVGSGYGYGYSGSFSGSTSGGGGGGGDVGGFFPGPPIGPIGDFENPYFNGGSAFSYSIAQTNNNAQVKAKSSITFVKNIGLRNYQHQGVPIYGMGYQHSGDVHNGYGGVDGSAIASASINPQGYSQTAAVYPENPEAPNIFSRFGAASNPGGSGGSYGVFTSSVSSSNTDPDGKTHRYQQATTTVNDNGKVSTYTVKNP